MKRILACAALVAGILLSPFLVDAGGVQRTLVVRGVQMPASLVLVVDKSGSMLSDNKYALACFEAKVIAAQADDGAKVKFAAFARDVEYHNGGNWIALPDAEALHIADAWLRTREVQPSAPTLLVGALASILEKDPDEAIGVVILTDSEPTDFWGEAEPTKTAASTIVALNAKRKHPAVIGVISIAAKPEDECFGLIVAKGAGGSYVRTKAK